ncbi:MAG: hypothetical protein WC894_05160 [Patescibacteria group bacterium]
MNKQIIKDFKKGIQIGTQNFLVPSVDSFVALHPEWQFLWFLARGFLLSVFQFQQERINSFVEYLEENKKDFTTEILKTDDFQQAFVITLENYLKVRQKEKLKIVKSIFLGYTKDVNKEKFELERFYSIVSQISIEGLEFLHFIEQNIFKVGENKKDLSRGLIGFFRNKENQSKHSINFETIKERLAELQSLGITRISGYATIADPKTFQDNVFYSFTDFGLKLFSFLGNNIDNK